MILLPPEGSKLFTQPFDIGLSPCVNGPMPPESTPPPDPPEWPEHFPEGCPDDEATPTNGPYFRLLRGGGTDWQSAKERNVYIITGQNAYELRSHAIWSRSKSLNCVKYRRNFKTRKLPVAISHQNMERLSLSAIHQGIVRFGSVLNS